VEENCAQRSETGLRQLDNPMKNEDKNGKAELAVSLGWAALATLLLCAHRGQQRQPKTLSPAPNGFTSHIPPHGPAGHLSARPIRPLWQLEKDAILSALEELNGDKLLAATKLGIGKTTLYRKLKKYGISVEPALAVRMLDGQTPQN
jgi:transcriptional regulator of acetoin/glycerol metabolism